MIDVDDCIHFRIDTLHVGEAVDHVVCLDCHVDWWVEGSRHRKPAAPGEFEGGVKKK